MNMKFLTKIADWQCRGWRPSHLPVLLLLAIFGSARAELPPAVANMEVIPAGSLIIPMDNSKQNIASNFNLQAYGMANALLSQNIQVKWAIRAGKAKDGTDFTVEAQRVYPSATAAATLSFAGGPFIIHKDWVSYATPWVAAYGNNVAVYETTQDVTVDVRFTLTQKKFVGVLDDGGNADIHTDVLDAAGFSAATDYTVLGAATLVNANSCLTLVSEPHWKSTTNNLQVAAVRQFIQTGGNFLAQCHAIEAYENNAAFGLFQTTGGYLEANEKDTDHTYLYPDLAFSQYEGALSDEGGSITDFTLLPMSTIRNGTHAHAHNTADQNLVIATSAQLTAGPGSNVMYLGGHKYQGNSIPKLNGRRMYLNAVMMPSARPAICGFDIPDLPQLSLTKAAFWPDGTPIPTGAVIPSGMEFKYMLYINNPNPGRSDVSVRDVLDPLFQYQTGTVQVDNSVAECAAAVCTPAEEQAIFNSVVLTPYLTDAVDGDVASYVGGSTSVEVGDGVVANQRLDVLGDAVWAITFSVRMP